MLSGYTVTNGDLGSEGWLLFLARSKDGNRERRERESRNERQGLVKNTTLKLEHSIADERTPHPHSRTQSGTLPW